MNLNDLFILEKQIFSEMSTILYWCLFVAHGLSTSRLSVLCLFDVKERDCFYLF